MHYLSYLCLFVNTAFGNIVLHNPPMNYRRTDKLFYIGVCFDFFIYRNQSAVLFFVFSEILCYFYIITVTHKMHM